MTASASATCAVVCVGEAHGDLLAAGGRGAGNVQGLGSSPIRSLTVAVLIE